MKPVIWITLLILALCQPAGAEMYKWVDQDGVTHFSDTPPPDQAVETMETAPPSDSGLQGSRPYGTGRNPSGQIGPPKTAAPGVSRTQQVPRVDLYVTDW